ncbi:hypothetical protein VNO78_12107 [Psophocarpus tetragonolobus]|uniref:1,4-alpha-D-glucan glucanohydrolase n=1 Tax=Psophocarpus tetragonolobus TaxID=3891 RepID=A0AAN9SQ56_PSOTE
MSSPMYQSHIAPKGHTNDACFSFKDEDFVKFVLGKMNSHMALLKGAMKVKESLSGAQKFTSDIKLILGWYLPGRDDTNYSDGTGNLNSGEPYEKLPLILTILTLSVVTAFDFTTKQILQYAVQGELWTLKDSNGKPPGMIDVKPENAVTFIDNHDIGTPLGKVVSILPLTLIIYQKLLVGTLSWPW